jgi:hypothetical protein
VRPAITPATIAGALLGLGAGDLFEVEVDVAPFEVDVLPPLSAQTSTRLVSAIVSISKMVKVFAFIQIRSR